jgi:hypothetical protein
MRFNVWLPPGGAAGRQGRSIPAGESGANPELERPAAEGATAPETLRQKGREGDDNAGKRGNDPAADGVSVSDEA